MKIIKINTLAAVVAAATHHTKMEFPLRRDKTLLLQSALEEKEGLGLIMNPTEARPAQS